MEVTEIKYQRTVRTGEYENEIIGATATPTEGVDIHEEFAELKALVNSQVSTTQGATATAPAPKKNKKAAKQTPAQEETATQESEEDTFTDGDDGAAEAQEAAPAEPKKKKTFKSKAAAYDREVNEHRSILATFLDTKIKKEVWRAKDSSMNKRVLKAAATMAGEQFLDKEGNILPEFGEELLKRIKATKAE